jgi:hypothetical protein
MLARHGVVLASDMDVLAADETPDTSTGGLGAQTANTPTPLANTATPHANTATSAADAGNPRLAAFFGSPVVFPLRAGLTSPLRR